MKKILFFAIALVAGALAFTSCEGNDPQNAIIGEWSYDAPAWESGYYDEFVAIFNEDGTFQLRDYGHEGPGAPRNNSFNYFEGTYSIKGDIVNAHFSGHGWYFGDEKNPVSSFEPWDEKIKYSIDGNKLTLIRYYGEDYQAEPEVYTKQ